MSNSPTAQPLAACIRQDFEPSQLQQLQRRCDLVLAVTSRWRVTHPWTNQCRAIIVGRALLCYTRARHFLESVAPMHHRGQWKFWLDLAYTASHT
jgi:hypothetical protein